MSEAPPRAVLFDYGLTLVTFRFPRAELVNAMEQVRPWLGPDAPPAETLVDDVLLPIDWGLAGFDGCLDEVDYLDFFDRGWRRAGFEVPRDTLYRILDAEQRCWDEAATPAPDALATLDGLRARGVRTGICSNAPFPPEMVRRQLCGKGITQRADAVVLSSDVGRRKPAPELYEAALQALGVPAADTLYVGDKVREDFEGPRAAGMRAVLCTALARHDPPADVPTIARLEELLQWIP
ncbi:MAG TPA: HAD family hydrolase [Candidatus Binatia bacterium]|nr:HAD family hydrolase [Candidatus Binatia bacterium]